MRIDPGQESTQNAHPDKTDLTLWFLPCNSEVQAGSGIYKRGMKNTDKTTLAYKPLTGSLPEYRRLIHLNIVVYACALLMIPLAYASQAMAQEVGDIQASQSEIIPASQI